MKNIPFARVVCDGRELELVKEVLESGWLTTAAKAHELERKFAELVGATHACAVNSCTAALHLALEALGVGPGDKVLVPTWTFTATAEVVRYLNADPVIIDVDPQSCLLTPEIVEAALQKHPDAKVLMVVHFGGQAAEMVRIKGTGILDVCRKYGVRIVEDAAHALPARQAGRMVGAIGDVTCFSFYANKTITTGEGGMLTTNDPSLYERCKLMRLHGIDRDVWNRYRVEGANWEYDVIAPGFKYNMPDISAAVGLAQLERAESMRGMRQACATHYFETLEQYDFLTLPWPKVAPQDHAWHLFPIVLKPTAPISRNDLISQLAGRGIGTSVHYKPLHRMTYYRERYGLEPASFPNAESVWHGCLSLPIYSSLSPSEIGHVTDTLRTILDACSKTQAPRLPSVAQP